MRASLPCRSRMPSLESFQPWLTQPRRGVAARTRRTRRRPGRRSGRSSRAPAGRWATGGRRARGRRSSRRSRRTGSATAAWRPRSRSRAGTAARRCAPSRPSGARAGSCRARRRGSGPRGPPGAAARTSSVSTATCGRTHSAWNEAMIASRPNRVANHGHAGGDVALALARAVVDQQPQVADGPLDREVHQLVVGPDLGHAAVPRVVRRGDLVRAEHRHLGEQALVGLGSSCFGARRRRPRPTDQVDPAQLARLALGQRPVPGEPDPAGVDGARDRRGRPARRCPPAR